MGNQGDGTDVGTGDEGHPRSTDLPLVGPATAAAIDAAAFDAVDILERRVSYVMLREAGINPGVAARMRRRYSLVWSFQWRFGGDDLPDRAAQVRGFRAPERSWIDASGRPVTDDDDATIETWNDWIDDSFSNGHESMAADTCPRCGSDLATYVMGERERVHCESCGYVAVDIAADSGTAMEAADRSDSWARVLEQFRQRR